MTDNVCYSILKTATQQIIQSAGFEAANNSSIDTLTDVFGKYIELLGSTVSAYANLNGRTIGNSFDLMEAMSEVDIQPKKLKVWLEEEGKFLTPCWSDQSDPGRLIQGVINGGKPAFDDVVEYRYGTPIVDYDIPSPTFVDSPIEQDANDLPDYIPSYLPPFPEIKQDEIVEEISFQKQQQLLQQKKEQEELQQQQQQQQQLPVLVKNRKKPIENPFTHIIPFEDSSLTTDNEDGTQQQPLSLLVDVNKNKKRTEEEEEETITKRRKIATSSLVDALSNIKPPQYKLGEGLIDKNDELFKNQTQNAAAPGNYLFNHDIGVFDQVVRTIADPMVISKLTCPNLQTDIAVFNSPNAPSNLYQEVRSSPGPSSPERSSSMLAALAGGSSALKKSGLKKLSSSQSLSHIPSTPMSLSSLSNHTISKHSVDINAIKTGDSKYIIKKKRMLLEKQQLLERQQQEKDFPQQQQQPQQTPPQSAPVQEQTQTHKQHAVAPPILKSTPTTTNHAAAPINNSALPKPIGPISLSSFSSSSASSSTLSPLEKEKKKQKSKGPKLMLNFASLPPPTITEDVSSPNTPKIRFKIKPPEQQPASAASASAGASTSTTPKSTISLQQYQQQKQKDVPIKLEKQQPMLSSPIPRTVPPPPPPSTQQSNFSLSHNGYSAEEIRCICENPTVDYGTFMIACDRCSIWFHGSCVGIAESDQVEEWYCRRCRG
ncbi:uncharacterized protein EV154DRAFT_528548 [Mucor mucedo]|uniref:uncharacterized protein n=1 Tax=Mucor mucedo TaxID=29922 RepID=UPI00221EC692|nr:uncharacterized protein EV154DRAFT_528548 [Mucor mucedo]KAI7873228.1 hypothetical protein EV154DRAFT_528548 [Mucor mucedo]